MKEMEKSRKRKAGPMDLIRRVRVRREEVADSEEDWDGVSSSSESPQSGEDENDDVSEVSSSDGDEDEGEDASEPEIDASKISFGALAKAQAAVQGSSTRPPKSKPKTEAGSPETPISGTRRNLEKGERDQRKKPESSGSGGNGAAATATEADSEPPAKKKKSKHAPEEVTSKRPVSRYREVVTPSSSGPVRKPRDPRFDRPVTDAADVARLRRNYSFLDQYREDEMQQLRQALKQAKAKRRPAHEVDELKRALASMESQKQAREKRDAEEALLEEHRKKEKELVRQGKKPFYLKKAEQKKMLLMDRYAGMSQGQVDRAIERKRKKVAGKEKKALPFARRRGAAEDAE